MISLQEFLPIIFISGLAVCLVTLVNTDFGIIILIFSMLFSPEFSIGGIPGRAVVVRIDDILLLVVFFTWLAKMAISKETGLLKKSPLNPPIICFLCINIFSTVLAIISGSVRPTSAFFYILKYIEYFMLFFLILNNLHNYRQIKKFIAFLLITCFIVTIYTSTQIGKVSRITAPFEGEPEPNTLGGYLLLLFAVNLGIFLYSKPGIWKFSSAFLCLFIILSFLHTLSRGSYLAFIAMYLTFVILTQKKKSLLIAILLLSIIFLPSILPIAVIERIKETFVPGVVYKPLGTRIVLDESASARVETWRSVLDKVKDRPIFGYGVTGMGLIDTQLPLVLGETGIIGLWIFIWLMMTIFINVFKTFKTARDDWGQGLALGFLGGFIGLLFHAFSASTFIIIRIMEPFWFLVAIVIMLPEIINLEKS